MKIVEKKINEGATNSDIYRAVKKMVENTYYKSRNYEVINTSWDICWAFWFGIFWYKKSC